MKTTLKKLMILGAFLFISGIAFGQAPSSPPPPPSAPGQSGDATAGGGAPLVGGLGILLALAAGYGAKKVYDARKEFRKK